MPEEQRPKYTPGPWVNVGAVGFSTGIATGDHWVALVYGKNVNPSSDADADLIAAAPELLEALRGLLRLTDTDFFLRKVDGPITNADQSIIDSAFIAAESAIAKAEGRNA